MKRYKNFSKDSGVVAYESGKDRILIEFRDGRIYTYSVKSTGAANIAAMKLLAESGRGLSTFISTTVKDQYESRTE